MEVMRFAAEKTLGRLARWLRLLGFDTIFESDVNSRVFFERLEPERTLLTRTRYVRKKYGARRLIFIGSNDPFEQLKQVIGELELKPEDIRPFSRCLKCNIAIVEIDKDSVFGQVPDYIWETHQSFRRCNQCGRIYWAGTHIKRSMERIKELFA